MTAPHEIGGAIHPVARPADNPNTAGREPLRVLVACEFSATVHKLAVAQADGALTDRECLDMETEVEAAIEALSAVKMRCEAIRKRRMAA